MKKEAKEIIWHSQNELPTACAANVLVRLPFVCADLGVSRNVVRYEIWNWFKELPNKKGGFFRDGQLLNDSTYVPIFEKITEFEWCYLTRADDSDEYEVNVF